jgi:hypothetical protein
MLKTYMTKWRAGEWCGMAETDKPIPAIPADLRGKEMSIPAGYLHENKQTAGIAGIGPNPYICAGIRFMCDARLHALEIESVGGYPRYPRRVRVFKHLTCGDRIRKLSPSCEIHKMKSRAEEWRGAKR